MDEKQQYQISVTDLSQWFQKEKDEMGDNRVEEYELGVMGGGIDAQDGAIVMQDELGHLRRLCEYLLFVLRWVGGGLEYCIEKVAAGLAWAARQQDRLGVRWWAVITIVLIIAFAVITPLAHKFWSRDEHIPPYWRSFSTGMAPSVALEVFLCIIGTLFDATKRDKVTDDVNDARWGRRHRLVMLQRFSWGLVLCIAHNLITTAMNKSRWPKPEPQHPVRFQPSSQHVMLGRDRYEQLHYHSPKAFTRTS